MSLYESAAPKVGLKTQLSSLVAGMDLTLLRQRPVAVLLPLLLLAGWPLQILVFLAGLVGAGEFPSGRFMTELVVGTIVFIAYGFVIVKLVFVRQKNAIFGVWLGLAIAAQFAWPVLSSLLYKSEFIAGFNFLFMVSQAALLGINSTINVLALLFGIPNLKYSLSFAVVALNLLALWRLLIIHASADSVESSGWIKVFASRSSGAILVALAALALVIPVGVKTGAIDHDAQVKYLGADPGRIQITSLGYHRYICYASLAFSVKGPRVWDAAQVEIVGRNASGAELFRTQVRANLANYDFIKISPPSGLCAETSRFTIERFSEFQANGLTSDEVTSRARLLTYSMDPEHRQDVTLGAGLAVAKENQP